MITMILLQIAGGTLLALLLWAMLRLTLKAALWAVGIAMIVAFIFPGILLLLGGLVFVTVSLLATLGLLVLLSAFRT
ncbi:hypothetical protein ACFQI7_21555 [Paenibacillus allorhizosphaerae]|uniref:Uncharacterized protein n=1 Tax=Paenibacillus allorhizosphaerae TaxID=2849866 RepID=A0ABN7TUS8_9BACL|nr:hypothetical protein [Paenibacillus allorhizosphaerae]CAG7651003.1 hypothetical protein PAECIP111802_04860 [Paenibacillus allorhizosphaerae]